MSLKHQEEIKELKEEHEGEIKVKISIPNLTGFAWQFEPPSSNILTA
jgi:hypothetical protein